MHVQVRSLGPACTLSAGVGQHAATWRYTTPALRMPWLDAACDPIGTPLAEQRQRARDHVIPLWEGSDSGTASDSAGAGDGDDNCGLHSRPRCKIAINC